MRYDELTESFLPTWREFLTYFGKGNYRRGFEDIDTEHGEFFEVHGVEFDKTSDYFRWLKCYFRKMGPEIIAYRGLYPKIGYIPHKLPDQKLVDLILRSPGLGTHWSEDVMELKYSLTAKIPITSIDWNETIKHRLFFPMEMEFTVTGPVSLIQISDSEYNKVLWTGNKEMNTK